MSDQDTYPWLWDVDLDAATFRRLLHDEERLPGLDWAWAMKRLIEYAPWSDIRTLLPRDRFRAHWPELAPRIRSASRREGMDYVYQQLQKQSR